MSLTSTICREINFWNFLNFFASVCSSVFFYSSLIMVY
uniref:Uncharacterized protein n=1 Tax=Arundo donax TaxID=35708 RepID=A0A0A9HJU0_ARUDO